MKLLYSFIFYIIFQVSIVVSHLSEVTETPLITGDFHITTKQAELVENLYRILKQRNILKKGRITHCLDDLGYALDGIRLHNKDIQKMVDATGKVGSGLISGKLQFWGDFDQCSDVYVPRDLNSSKGDFYAQYCRLDLWQFGNITMPVRWGLCIPDSCDGPVLKSEIFEILNCTDELSQHFEKDIVTSIGEAQVACHPKKTKLDSGAYGFICVVAVMLTPCILGCFITLLKSLTGKELYKSSNIEDTTGQQHVEEGKVVSFQMEVPEDKGSIFVEFLSSVLNRIPVRVQKFFQCFCPILNTMGLFHVKESSDQVQCLDGIRLFDSLWVILSHTLGYLLPVLGNTIETATLVDQIAFQIIINGFYSVDIFFVLSAFLQAWQFLKRKGELKFFSTIFHRLVRLLPIYAVVIGFETVLFHLLGSGPLWPVDGRQCTGYWWTNLIFLNNILYSDHQCMVWAWYMASDFQYFVFSLLILCLFKRWPRLGLAVVGVFGFASVVFSFVVTYVYNMFTGPANNIDLFLKNPALMDSKFSEYFLGLYIHPFGRYHVYAIGIFLAYFLYNRKENKDRVVKGRYNKVLFYVGAISAATFSYLCVFGLNFFGQTLRTTLFASFYNALHHLLFSLSFAWFVYNCATGKLGFFNRILSARILVPLSRLSYSGYLLHPILMEAYFLLLRAPFQYSHLSLVILNFGFVFVTYMIAFVVTILFGAPFINLERYFKQT